MRSTIRAGISWHVLIEHRLTVDFTKALLIFGFSVSGFGSGLETNIWQRFVKFCAILKSYHVTSIHTQDHYLLPLELLHKKPLYMCAHSNALCVKWSLWNYDFFLGGKYKASHLSDVQARTRPQFCHNIHTEAIKPGEKYNTIHWTTASYYFPIHGQ